MLSAFSMLRNAALLALALGASSAMALSIDGSGRITNWGLTPFSNADGLGTWDNGAPPLASGVNGINSGVNGGITYTEGNNAAPVNYSDPYYPGAPEYVPAPADEDAGEKFDHEFLGWRISGGNLQVLGITSMDFVNGVTHDGRTFRVGDLFLSVDGNSATGAGGGYDFAFANNGASVAGYTSELNDPLHPGDDSPTWTHPDTGLYSLASDDDIHHVTNEGGFGDIASLAGPNNPFAVRAGAAPVLTNWTLSGGVFNYGTVFGANEDNTWILEWTIDLTAFGANFDASRLRIHWGTECGNDYLDAPPVVPEPATLSLLGLGLASLGLVRRRRKA